MQTRRGGLQRAVGVMSSGHSRSDQLASHVAQRISRLARQPAERIGMLGDGHPGAGSDLDTDRGEVGSRTIIGAVRIARRHPHPHTGFDKRGNDANSVSEDVLAAGDGPTLEIVRRDLDAQGGRDRGRPRHPFELRRVHGQQVEHGNVEPSAAQPRCGGRGNDPSVHSMRFAS